jgi:hypothetical protein
MRGYLVAIVLGVALSGCGGSKPSPSPSAPSPISGVTLSGTYAGSASDSTGAGTMSWTASQSGSAVSGSVTARTSVGIVAFTGNLTGALTGSSLTFSITIPADGISGFPGCSATIDGTATGVSNTAIAGTYTGTNSCGGSFSAGHFNLTKQ